MFTAPDLRKRHERQSPYDLIVQKRFGDIKHTTYFLHTARSFPLKCDFYLTRLYDVRKRRYWPIVILTEDAWHDLNGAVAECSLEQAAEHFPAPVQIVFEKQRLVVITFELWKTKIKLRQEQEHE